MRPTLRVAPLNISVYAREVAGLATVQIGTNCGSGSATVLRQSRGETDLLTAYHVVKKTTWIYVRSGQEFLPARVLDVDEGQDLARLRTATLVRNRAVRLASCEAPTPFLAVAAGYTKLARLTWEAVRVVGIYQASWMLDRRLWAGRSGGPLVNEGGELIGIQIETTPTVGFARRLDSLRRFLKECGLV